MGKGRLVCSSSEAHSSAKCNFFALEVVCKQLRPLTLNVQMPFGFNNHGSILWRLD